MQRVIDAYAALLLTAGSLADRLGRGRVYLLRSGSTVCVISPDRDNADARTLRSGLGGAAMFATLLALLAREFRGRERRTAFGL